MARDPKYDILFEPIEIGPKTLRNRFFQVAHCVGAGSDKPGFQGHFRAMKAEGGWAAVSTEYCSIAPESDDTHRVSARLWDEGDVRNLSLMCDLLHKEGALAAVEIWHGGPNAAGQESRVPARGPSQIPSAFEFMRSCKEMDKDDIREVQQLYVDAVKRARDAGFDIMTIYCAHTEALPHQFLLPYFNKRTDEYGGSFENRARFTREVMELVRDAVGDDCAIAIRFGIDTLYNTANLGIKYNEEGWRFIEHLDDLVDLWDINVAEATEWGEDAAPSRNKPENHEKPYVDKVKEHTDKPVLNVGRFVNADTMVEVIRSRQADIIGSARGSIADPFLPKKIEEGRLDDIRECIGCNICISRWEIGGPPLVCTQNATSGEEYRRGWHPERFSRAENADNDVLVVGAGPAGMECAMVLGKRGLRRVHLVEAEAEMGGIMRWIPQLPGLGEWARVVNYRKIQLAKLKNVEFIPGQRLDAQAVRDYGAEIVIVATGSHWAGDGMNGVTHDYIPGADATQAHVLTPDQVMVEGKAAGERVIVYDTDGYFMGVSIAELLAREGKQVRYVTPFEAIAPYTHVTLENPRLNRTLRGLGVSISTGHLLSEIEPGRAQLMEVWDESTQDIESDSVVLVTQRRSNDSLFNELKADGDGLAEAGITDLHRIGDCVVPQIIADAIFSGHRLAREIDSPNPDVPLPYIRERRLLNSTEADYQLESPAIGAGLVRAR